jgi:hypothetical protein
MDHHCCVGVLQCWASLVFLETHWVRVLEVFPIPNLVLLLLLLLLIYNKPREGFKNLKKNVSPKFLSVSSQTLHLIFKGGS